MTDKHVGTMPVSLEEILDERERRANRQRQLLDEWPLPLVCLTLNIPGRYKAFPLAARCFREGMEQIEEILRRTAAPVRHSEFLTRAAGYTAYYAVDGDPGTIKAAMVALEESHPLGRLLDIDVLGPDGQKLSRTQSGEAPRRCLLCDEPAVLCARSRAHDAGAVFDKSLSLMRSWLWEAREKLTDATTEEKGMTNHEAL